MEQYPKLRPGQKVMVQDGDTERPAIVLRDCEKYRWCVVVEWESNGYVEHASRKRVHLRTVQLELGFSGEGQ
jgi:hypothetical protein